MLTHIHIHNFALFESASVGVEKPFIVVTGETGAGKSLFLQSLKFLSGEKKPSTPPPDSKIDTTVSCQFTSSFLAHAERHLSPDIISKIRKNQPQSICVSRILSPNGKSKASINEIPINNTSLKNLMQSIIDINAQHQHLGILEEKNQLALLDRFGNHTALCQQVSTQYANWQHQLSQQKSLFIQLAELEDLDQLNESILDLQALRLDQTDFDHLNAQQKRLYGRKAFLTACQTTVDILNGDHDQSVLTQLHRSHNTLESYHETYPETKDVTQHLTDSLTICQEAVDGIENFLDQDYTDDYMQLEEIEQTLSSFHDIARKYRTSPDRLHELYAEIQSHIDTHHGIQNKLSALKESLDLAETTYTQSALSLSQKREHTAKLLSHTIQKALPSLNLTHAVFHIKMKTNIENPGPLGCDQAQFLFSGNPGIPLSHLKQCASGGELARLSLLITATIPSEHPKVLIFDEADVGVSGKTASLIGKLLANVSKQHQIICLTHSPQVAAYGMQHWHIEKSSTNQHTATSLKQLSHQEHITEVARLLSGIDISQESIATAEQLCLQSTS